MEPTAEEIEDFTTRPATPAEEAGAMLIIAGVFVTLGLAAYGACVLTVKAERGIKSAIASARSKRRFKELTK